MDNVAFPERHFEHLWEEPATADEQREITIPEEEEKDDSDDFPPTNNAWETFMDTIAFPEKWGTTASSNPPAAEPRGVEYDEMAGWTGLPVTREKDDLEVRKEELINSQTRLELDVDERAHLPILIHIT